MRRYAGLWTGAKPILITATLAAVAASVLLGEARAQAVASESPEALVSRLGLIESEHAVRELAGWHAPKKIIVDDELDVSALRSVAPGVTFVTPTASDLDLADADALIGSCDPRLLAKAKRLFWVQAPADGVERCVPAIKDRTIVLTNMQRVDGATIAEHAIALALALARNLNVYVLNQQQDHWAPSRNTMQSLHGKTLLVVGLGGIGTEVARRADGLGLKVTAIRATGKQGPSFVSYVGTPDELLALAKQADVIVNTTPLTPATEHLFNAKFFAATKPTAFFVNVGRGGSVDTDALVAALKAHQLAGAGLDVVEPEPLPPGHPLWRLPNVIVTPHVAAGSDLPRGDHLALIRENLRRYVGGEKLLSVVDLQRGY